MISELGRTCLNFENKVTNTWTGFRPLCHTDIVSKTWQGRGSAFENNEFSSPPTLDGLLLPPCPDNLGLGRGSMYEGVLEQLLGHR